MLSGTEKGRRGKVIAVFPKSQRIIVEGVKLIKKHVRKSQQYPEGAILEREGTVHVSNVMLAEKFDARLAKREQTKGQDEDHSEVQNEV